MDTMYRNKARKADTPLSAEKKKQKKHISDSFQAKARPRETHPDTVDSKKRISRNLNKLNRNLVEHPSAKAKEEALVASEDRGAKVVTRTTAISAPIPVAMIFYLAVFLIVFMYFLFLNVQVEEYSHSIDVMESEVAELKEEATRLELQMESKFDLDEVERIATQEYGMVVSSSLAKKYVSVAGEEDVWQETEQEKEPSFVEKFIEGFKLVFGDNKE